MSKFNVSKEGTNKTINREGHVAYKMSDKEHLVTSVLTTMFGEPKYYGSTDMSILRKAIDCAHNDPEFLAKLTCYARNVGNMRSISHVLTAIIAHEAHEYTRQVIRNVVLRPDDILEIMACYKTLYGKPFPNAMKREIAKEMNRFNEYNIAKYNSDKKEFNFKDVLRIVHPIPINEEKQIIFNHIINDTLETPYTWETELSEKGNTKEVWEELIASGKVGYMALLRNLRNIIKSGADYIPVLEKLADGKEVLNSKQLPFRFYSAYREIEKAFDNDVVDKVRPYLDKALEYSVTNIPTILKGRTLIAVDVSGSMTSHISSRSDVTCRDIATTLACMSAKMCEDVTVIYFNAGSYYTGVGRFHNGYISGMKVYKYGTFDSILGNISNAPLASGGTDMSLPMEWAIEKDKASRPFDRVIYLSDNQCNYQKGTVQRFINKYNKKNNTDIWVHAIDLQGYGTQQFIGKRFNLIAGWGDSVLEFIHTAEQGLDSLVKRIENYELK